ncbi:acyl-CoA dehydrogenase, partial [Streptomyces sp. NPDC127110]|uniref:acyl-CoA dehydrogenase n=1 Tax=Streptomyces sp. NPDC127110 TaxID=3345362 RepID=UPI003641965F
ALGRATTEDCWYVPDGGGLGSGPAPEVMRRCALAKAAADRLAERAISRSRSAAGAASFFSENRLLEYHGLAMAFQSAGGDNRLILLDAARSMTAGIGYVPPAGDAPDRWLVLFRARERLLYEELTGALRAAEAAGTDGFRAWDDQSGLAERFAAAHLARVTAETVHTALPAQDPQSDSTVPHVRRALYLLLCLEETLAHTGWFHEAGLLTVEDTRLLRDRLTEVCHDLAPQADTVLEVLGVPAEMARGPLAGQDYVADLSRMA